MGSLSNVCREIVSDAPDAVGCGIVDLNTGMLLASHTTAAYFTQSYLDAVAAAALDMFRGKNVRRVEQLLGKHRGGTVKDTFEEIQVTSSNTFHFMKLMRSKGILVVLVTRTTSNLGMGWSSLRNAVLDIEATM